jgi:uncharacterized cofD-like protein
MNGSTAPRNRILKWLVPGMHVKRWVALILLGIIVLVSGAVLFFLEWSWLVSLKQYLRQTFALSPMPLLETPWREILALVIVVLALGLIVWGVRRLIASLVQAVLPEHLENLADVVYEKRLGHRGLKIVALGGGTGLSSLLRGLKLLPVEATALVTVADDGGSSGKLRQELGILPPGDIRRCLVALSETEPLMENLFQYRFQAGSSLEGHNFGNLFIAALTKTTGDFGLAVMSASQVLRVKGRALPVTLDDVTLRADFTDGTEAMGETKIRETGKVIKQLHLEPANSQPTAGVLDAIQQADVILLGPGSLFTSVLPPLLQPEVARAVRESGAVRIYIANIMTEHGETDGLSIGGHLKILFEHAGGKVADYCLINHRAVSTQALERYRMEQAELVKIDLEQVRAMGVIPILADLSAEVRFVWHDPEALAHAIWDLVLDVRRHRRR